MSVSDILGTRIILNGLEPMPPRDNDNRRLLPDWMTAAELMQWVRQEKTRLSQEVASDSKLWSCPEHRRTWGMTLAIEQLALQQCFGVRNG